MKLVQGDWWPDRDEVCHRVAYDFLGADHAIKQCKGTDLVIQAGGNVGAWPKYLKTRFKKVVTFEPSTENYELMLKNISGMDIRAYHAALWTSSGRCTVEKNTKNCGDDQTREGEGIDRIAIDDLELSPDLIYLDIQGDEFPALKGAVQTIERCSPIIAIEWDRKMLRHGDPVPFLESLGYKLTKKYKQDYIFNREGWVEPPEKVKPIPDDVREFKTKSEALGAMRYPPKGTEVDITMMAWKHPNGAKTHFTVRK